MFIQILLVLVTVVHSEVYYLNQIPSGAVDKYTLNRNFTMWLISNGDDITYYPDSFEINIGTRDHPRIPIIDDVKKYNNFTTYFQQIIKDPDASGVVFYKNGTVDTASYKGVIYVPAAEADGTNYKVYQSLPTVEVVPSSNQTSIIFSYPDGLGKDDATEGESSQKFYTIVDVSNMIGSSFCILLKTPEDTPQLLYDRSNGLPITEFILPEEYFHIIETDSSTESNFSVLAQKRDTYSSNGIVYLLNELNNQITNNRIILLDKIHTSSKISFRITSIKCPVGSETKNEVIVSSPSFNLAIEDGSIAYESFEVLSEFNSFSVNASCNYIIEYVIEKFSLTTALPHSTTKNTDTQHSTPSTPSTKKIETTTNPIDTTTMETTTQSSCGFYLYHLIIAFATFYLI